MPAPIAPALFAPLARTLILAVALHAASSTVRARAQDATDPAATAPAEPESPSPVVRALLVEAVAEYDAGHYAEAQALFRRAHELAPSARTLRGLGMAAFELRQYTVALRAFEEALTSSERPLTDEQRAHVEELRERARVFVSTLVVHVRPADAALRVDGSPTALGPEGLLRLDPGPHTFDVSHPDHLPRRYELQLEPGGERELEAILEPRPVAPPPDPGPSDRDTLLALGATAGVIGLLGAVVGAATGVVALGDVDQLRNECEGFVCPGELEATRDRAQTLAVVTDALGIASAVVGTVGVGLLLAGALSSSGPTSETSVALGCSAEGCRLDVRGRW